MNGFAIPARLREPTAGPARTAGFTLLELMAALGVAAVLIAIGVPSFQNFVRNSRITAPANELLTAAYMARSEAIKRRATTVFCFSTNPTAALPDCAGTGAQGWIVFVDVANIDVPSANDRNGRVDANEPILLRHDALGRGVTARTYPAGNGSYVGYAASGMARSIGPAGTPITGVVLCDVRGNVAQGGGDSAARALQLTATGRPRVTRSVTDIAAMGGC